MPAFLDELTNRKRRDYSAIATRYIIQFSWWLACLATLGFPAKYRERLRLFEDLVNPEVEAWSEPPTYSDRGNTNTNDAQKTMRQKQQEEWDRLNIAVSVITATSAAALSIQATSSTTHIYWLVTAFYSIAFGLSLQGLILITYMTISAGGCSDEAIGRLARGKLAPTRCKVVKLAAFIMALPTVLATYSSISLLAGLVTMIFAGSGEGVDTKSKEYKLVAMIPIGITFFLLCAVLLVCEAASWEEINQRRKFRDHYKHISEGLDVRGCRYCVKVETSRKNQLLKQGNIPTRSKTS